MSQLQGQGNNNNDYEKGQEQQQQGGRAENREKLRYQVPTYATILLL